MGKNKLHLKIRPTVLTIFIFVISSVILVTLSLQYHFLKDLALNATNDNLIHISEKIEQKIRDLDRRNNNLLSDLQTYSKIHKVNFENEREKLLPILVNYLKNHRFIYAIYAGNKNGNFYEVINLNIDDKLREKYNTTPAMKWLVVKIYEENGKRVQCEEFLDRNFLILRKTKKEANYDPSIRPWFKRALSTDEIIKTDPYMYTNLEARGITYAKHIKGTARVIGVDVSLNSMSSFLKKQLDNDKGEIYLFKEKDNLTAAANYNEHYKKLDFKALREDLTKLNVDSEFKIISLEDKDYFLYFSEIKSIYKNKDYLAILLPLDMVLKPYMEKIVYSFIITGIILLFTIPLIWFSTKLLVNPIHNLANENEKIIKRKFSEVKFVQTHIAEISDLSKSLTQLSVSVQKHEEDQRKLMDSFIKLIASAIDAKSKYTGGHCERVPVLSMMLARAASKDETIFKDFKIKNEDEERELKIAAWLHDCGKVTTPEYVVDKATKLETIYNRIHEIRTRFEVLYRDLHIKALENILTGANREEEYEKLQKEQNKLIEEFEIIAHANIGGEFMDDETIKKVESISKRTWTRYFDNSIGISRDERNRLEKNTQNVTPQIEKLLDDKIEHIIPREEFIPNINETYGFKQEVPEHLYNQGEVYNLSIKRGTLTEEERYKINEHMKMSIIMLEQLPFQEHLKRVPEYAGAHHETLIGTGYPRRLTKEQMSLPARILAVADVFEALTSSDRPYKEPKTLSESIKILSFMVKDQHLDKDIFEMFLKTGIYKEYAKDFLEESQIDEVDISKYLG